jgi:hypothetical protein
MLFSDTPIILLNTYAGWAGATLLIVRTRHISQHNAEELIVLRRDGSTDSDIRSTIPDGRFGVYHSVWRCTSFTLLVPLLVDQTGWLNRYQALHSLSGYYQGRHRQ